MVELYYFLPLNEVEYVIECGLKLSKWFDKEVIIEGENKRCISALLNPKDDVEKYYSDKYTCVKIEVPPHNCYISEGYIYRVGYEKKDIRNIYHKSIIPLKDYIFGSYRFPECLVTSTIIAGQVSIPGKHLDSPILFENSEQLYINNLIENLKDANECFNDYVLYYFYSKLAEIGKADKIINSTKEIAVFIDKNDGKAITIKVPHIELEV